MNRYFTVIILLILVLLSSEGKAQGDKKITLDEIFRTNTFAQKTIDGISWMNDSQYYTTMVRSSTGSQVLKMNVTTGSVEDVLIDGSKIGVNFSSYTLSADESKALISSEVESIYRRSTKAVFHLINLKSGLVKELLNGEKIMYATLSPRNDKIAFVKENNLFVLDLNIDRVLPITTDGKFNHIINGVADWVYEEEFSMSQAFEWSPDGNKLAYIRFDESEVPEFNMQLWGTLYPQDYKFKYPKAGEQNSEVDIFIYDIALDKKVKVDTGKEKDIYLPRIYWTSESGTLAFIKLNRLQNEFSLYYSDANSGESKLILNESSNTYVDLNYNDYLHFLEDKKGFILTSEKDGFKHIYHYNNQGEMIRQITSGEWEVTDLVGVNENEGVIYFISTEISPLERNLYVINLDGRRKKILTPDKGTYRVNMSKDFKFFINNFSDAHTPGKIALHQSSGKLIKTLEENSDLKRKLGEYAFSSKEFFVIQTEEGNSLNAYMIKPIDFDLEKKYPVLMYVYGGPGSQLVNNSWGSTRELWHQHLAAEGYIIVSVDNRGTGGRGREFKHSTYGNLGKLEAEDQIAGARYLSTLPFVDSSRIGIWGWSYGGYMSSLALMIGNDIFKTAISVAPVTTWRFYDTIYTERYLQTPQLNAAGYDNNSPLNHVNKLKGNFLLVHGTGDDNVHFQNSVMLVDALIKADKQFETFYYPNRSHSISGGNATAHLFDLMTDFIKRKL